MGTSSSSSGPRGGVPLDTPWVDSIPSKIKSPLEQSSNDISQQEQEDSQQTEEPAVQPVEIAPPGRFGKARLHLGKYINSGDRGALKKALGSYSQKGMGGASRVASRMRASTSVGVEFFNFLQRVRDSTHIKIRDWVNQLTSNNLSADDIANEIINLIISTGGSREEESCRNTMYYAMSELLIIDPYIDLLKMDNDSIWTVIELFMANEAFNRFSQDIGQLFESNRYSIGEVVSRMNGIRDYLKSEISAQIQELRTDTSNPTKAQMNNLLKLAIENTFKVFEEEA